ncbi:hypothetical protein EOPP23_20920 [Endozoicomonas sp. OPT23]|nr:hypothetical protein [Endozoicomonas sp. OPT23]
MGTAAVESAMGFHLKQDDHQALGIFQISPRMHRNIWDRFLATQTDLSSLVRGLASQREFLAHPHLELATNLSYSAAIAWLVYYRTGKAIHKIEPNDIKAFGKLWHNHFHRHNPGTVESYVESYQLLILGEELEERQKVLKSSAD